MQARNQNMNFDTKNSMSSFMDDLSVLSEYTQNEVPKNNAIFCPECWEIPKLSLNTLNNKIISNCSQNFHQKEYTSKEFCQKCLSHSLSNIICKICKLSISQLNTLVSSDKSNASNNQNSLIYCEQCKDFYCFKCQKKHVRQKKNHLFIIISKIGVLCPFHNLSYSSYCFTCNKNICLKCVNNHISHKLIPFSKIKPFSQEISQKKMEINRERTELKKVELIFKDAINLIYMKFNKLMEYKLEEINFKENIIMTYEMRNNNFNSIINFRDLNVNFQKFNYNLFSPEGLNDTEILDDSIGIDKIRIIYDYLQNKKFQIFNANKKSINYDDLLNDTELKKELIYPKNLKKKDIRGYTYINNDDSDFEEKERYYELARSLEIRDIKTKKYKKTLINHKINKENKHYKINKDPDSDKKTKYCSINSDSNLNINDENNTSIRDINENDVINKNVPVSKSWVKPERDKIKNIQNSIPKEEKTFKLGDKYLASIRNKKEQFNSQENNITFLNNENINYIKFNKIDTETNDFKSFMNKSKEIDETEIINKTEKNSIPNYYTKKIRNKNEKLKMKLNSDEKEIRRLSLYIPKKIKTIYDNKKEIMNLIILHDNNFCTSSWDSSIKIFNSQTYELLLKINEPNNNDVCYVSQLHDDSIILCSNRIFKYRLFDNDKNYSLETIISGYNDYVIKVIELKDNSLVTCDWEYRIKVWKKILNNMNGSTQYELIKSNINEGEHLSSLCRINDNEFVSSSNSHLENGNDVLRFYDINYNNYKTINNISCSELVDTLCQINEQFLCVALQKWNSNQMKGIAVVDLIKKQIINKIQSDSMTCISLINNKEKIIITGGRDKTNKKSIIRQWKLKNKGELVQLYEICSEQNDAITSIKILDDGRILASNYDSTIVVLK